MPTSPTTSIDAVRRRLKDASLTNPTLSEGDIDGAIQDAVKGDYSRHRPCLLVKDITGTGKAYYKLTGIVTGWVDGVSRVESVECPALDPASASAGAPEFLELWEYELYQKDADVYLRLKTVTPSASETIRLTFTAQHVHDASTNTVRADDVVAVLDLAAALASAVAMGRAASVNDGIIKAGLNRDGEQGRWSQAYYVWLKRYRNHMGIAVDDGMESSLASAVFSPGMSPSGTTFGTWMTHRRVRYPRG